MNRANRNASRSDRSRIHVKKGSVMNLCEYGTDYVVASLSKEELLLIRNALCDVLDSIESFEFHFRMGGTKDEIKLLSQDIENILRQMQS